MTKGMRVIVNGRLRQRTFDTREGERRTVFEVEVDEVGPSLKYATASVNRVQRGQGGQGGQGGGFGGANSGGGQGGFGGGQGGGNRGQSQGGFGGYQQQSQNDVHNDDPWNSAPPAGGFQGDDDDPPF